MDRFHRPPHHPWIAVVYAVGCLALSATGQASEVLMKDGRILKGKLGDLVGLGDLPVMADTGDKVKQIVFLDDDLRRTFVSRCQIAEVDPDGAGQIEEKFNVRQRAQRNGTMIKSGRPASSSIQPFDEFGRRIVHHEHRQRPVGRHPGITEITPQWIKVEGVSLSCGTCGSPPAAIPRDVLHKILLKQIDPKNIEHRKKIARFYLQSERYDEARDAAGEPSRGLSREDRSRVQQQLDPSIRALRQLSAQKLLVGAEASPRRRAAPVRAGTAQEVPLRRRAGRDPPGGPGNDPGVRDPRGPPGEGRSRTSTTC